MASFQERVIADGGVRVRAIVRKNVRGERITKTKTFNSRPEAEIWAAHLESNIEEMDDIGEATLRGAVLPRVAYSVKPKADACRVLANSILGSKAVEQINFESLVTYLVTRSSQEANKEEVKEEMNILRTIFADMANTKTEVSRVKMIDEAIALANEVGI